MTKCSNIIYGLIALCLLLIGGNSLSAQKSTLYKERALLSSIGVEEGMNPSFLQEIQDSVLFTAKGDFSYGKGDFVNYFKPNCFYKLQATTDSYNRLNNRLVVYGWADYSYEEGKNAGYSSFLNPYKTPFNFIEKEEETKGEQKVESYNLLGAMSYKLTEKVNIGFGIDYKALDFIKLKDIRHSNEIVDLKVNPGVSCMLSENNTIGVAYTYKRYIESLSLFQIGNEQDNYYALLDNGLFMGLIHLYDENGILKLNSKKPWVAISHSLGVEHQILLNGKTKIFTELFYEKEKGHFGDESTGSIMYFKHNRSVLGGLFKLVKLGDSFSHILKCSGDYKELFNKENLFQSSTTEGGSSQITYYGENEIFNRKEIDFNLKYDILCGNTYKKAVWHIEFLYDYKNRKSKATYYPYFRKQEVSWHRAKLGVAKLFDVKRTDFQVRVASGFGTGVGGNIVNGMYVGAGSVSKPDYMNKLSNIEKDFFTGKRIIPEFGLRMERVWRDKTKIFTEVNLSYTKPFNTRYLTEDYFSLNFSVGLNF